MFGMTSFTPGMTFGELLNHWRGLRPEAPSEWFDDLRAQVIQAAGQKIPTLHWRQIEEADGLQRFAPVVTRVRKVPTRERLEFDVTLIPFDEQTVLTAFSNLSAYCKALADIKSFAPSLFHYLWPVATRFFEEWSDYIRKVVGDGADMTGPERLEVTRLIVEKTKKHTLVERIVVNPEAELTQLRGHSGDWRSFYEQLGTRADIERKWILCVEEKELRDKLNDVKAAWGFFRQKDFDTLYCSPKGLEKAVGKQPYHGHEVIEDYGDYLKLLSLPGGSYTAGTTPNVLSTAFREVREEDRRILRTMIDCSTKMTEDWFQSLRKL
jgi:hypothetical protein